MTLLDIIPAFALTALVLAMVPGQGVAMVLRQTMVGGARCAYISVAGNSVGLIIWGVASAVGLSSIFAHSHLAYDLLKLVGVAFLSFLGVQTLIRLRHDFGTFDYEGQAKLRLLAAFRLGLVTNLTNVKAAVFAVAFIPHFVPRDFSLVTAIIALACVQSFVALCWYVPLVASVNRTSVVLARPRVRRWLTGISAVGLLILATALLLSSPR
ncbi:MAG: LysE family translocator [Acidimicrobiales bacterium]